MACSVSYATSDSPSSATAALILRRGTTVLRIGSRDRIELLTFGKVLLGEVERAQHDRIVR